MLERNDMMVQWMHVTLKDRKSSDELRDCVGLVSIRNYKQRHMLRWFGHVERMDKDSWVKKCKEIVVEVGGHRYTTKEFG